MLVGGPRRRAAIDGALVVAITMVAYTLTGVGYALLSGLPARLVGGAVIASTLSSWSVLLVFVVLTGLVALSGWSRRVRLRLAMPSAIVAWLVGQAVLGLVAGMPLPGYVLWSGLRALPFLLAAFVAGLITSAVVLGKDESPAAAESDAGSRDAAPSDGSSVVPVVRAVALGVLPTDVVSSVA